MTGVRQGNTVFPKLFLLEDVFKSLSWEGKGLKIGGCYLNYLRYADDIILIFHNSFELEQMLQDLH